MTSLVVHFLFFLVYVTEGEINIKSAIVYMLGGTEIIQDWNLNTVFIASVHPPPRKLYFTWPFICLFLLPHER